MVASTVALLRRVQIILGARGVVEWALFWGDTECLLDLDSLALDKQLEWSRFEREGRSQDSRVIAILWLSIAVRFVRYRVPALNSPVGKAARSIAQGQMQVIPKEAHRRRRSPQRGSRDVSEGEVYRLEVRTCRRWW